MKHPFTSIVKLIVPQLVGQYQLEVNTPDNKTQLRRSRATTLLSGLAPHQIEALCPGLRAEPDLAPAS